MSHFLNVLIAEDDPNDAELCLHALRKAGFDPTYKRVDTSEEFVSALDYKRWDVVLSDYTMPQFNAMEALHLLQASDKEIPFIVVTGTIDEETAVNCLKRGADNYILKENLTRLGPAVEQALKMFDERRENRRLQNELRRSQKMEAIGTLASGVAHDCNNLLTVISNYAEVARRSLPTNHEALESLTMVDQAVQQAASVIKSLLAFAHKIPLQKTAMDLTDLVVDSIPLLRGFLPASVEIVENVPRDRRVWIMGDRSQIQQVLINLVVNAQDAMSKRGTLCLSLNVNRHHEADEAVLTVTDTGMGMSQKTLERAFDPFFTTKEPGKGTGLGLSVVHGIVTDHKGWIDATSQPGRGTRFDIRFPIHTDLPKAHNHSPEMDGSRKHQQGQLIILAEDNQYVREIMESALKSDGYQIITTDNGEDAMRAIHEHRNKAKLAILDLDLPKKSGLSCFDEIRTKHTALSTIIVSGNIVQFLKERPSAQGHVLAKPFRISEMLDLVQQTLNE